MLMETHNPLKLRTFKLLQIFSQIFWNTEKSKWISSSNWICLDKLELKRSVLVSEMYLWLIFLKYLGKFSVGSRSASCLGVTAKMKIMRFQVFSREILLVLNHNKYTKVPLSFVTAKYFKFRVTDAWILQFSILVKIVRVQICFTSPNKKLKYLRIILLTESLTLNHASMG